MKLDSSISIDLLILEAAQSNYVSPQVFVYLTIFSTIGKR